MDGELLGYNNEAFNAVHSLINEGADVPMCKSRRPVAWEQLWLDAFLRSPVTAGSSGKNWTQVCSVKFQDLTTEPWLFADGFQDSGLMNVM